MKRFFYRLLSIWREKLKLYFIFAVVGALLGVFILAPSYDYINQQNPDQDALSSIEYVFNLINDIIQGKSSSENMLLISFYAEIGAFVSVLFLLIYQRIYHKYFHLEFLKTELNRDLTAILRQGEGSYVEFKSSMRWDFVESRISKNLEHAILKTIAGFLNSSIGGTLLIGVNDEGKILGLEKDFQTLKKSNQDGYEQYLMTAITTNLGGDICSHIHILFHSNEGKDICRVIVTPANRPVFINKGNHPKFYVRTGGGTRDLNIKEALNFIAVRWKKIDKSLFVNS